MIFLCQFCRSAGVLPAWCVYTNWHRMKTEKGESPEYFKIIEKNTILKKHPVCPESNWRCIHNNKLYYELSFIITGNDNFKFNDDQNIIFNILFIIGVLDKKLNRSPIFAFYLLVEDYLSYTYILSVRQRFKWPSVSRIMYLRMIIINIL